MFDDFQPELLFPSFVKDSSPEGRDELSQQCRAKVVEWRWASDDMAFAFRQPFTRERFRHDPKWLKEGAKLKPDSKRHGLDAEGLIHVVEDMNSNGRRDETQINATYVTYKDNQTESVRYLSPWSLQLVRRRLYDGERLVREHFFGSAHGSERKYEWQGERLHRILSGVETSRLGRPGVEAVQRLRRELAHRTDLRIRRVGPPRPDRRTFLEP